MRETARALNPAHNSRFFHGRIAARRWHDRCSLQCRTREQEKADRGNRGSDSDGNCRFDSCRRSRRAVGIDFQAARGRSDGHVRTTVGVRDRVPATEREKPGGASDRKSIAADKPRGGVDVSGFTRAFARGFTIREATKMVSSVPVLLLGMVIISTIGSYLGYLLEPGRFEQRDAAELAVNRSGAEAQTGAQTGDRSPRLAA